MIEREDPDYWIEQVFAAKAVAEGGIVRRAVPWVEREIGRDRFLNEVARRGFHLLECAGQFIIICSDSPIRRWL
ncbi:N-(5'-phosphoribosyl)anthranilate isomerase [Marivita sp. S0852]|uniref:N-(5'-phosphoribosyl)anthranilate isomerase n=1 Tax=Marivita sp. S0852 TaxID=3373893 RepID=UPI003981C1C2